MADDGITVGLEDRITVKLEEGVTVAAEDSVTCCTEDGAVTTIPLNVERATTMADIVEVTALAEAVTQAVLAPLIMEKAPDVTEVIVGLEDRITVGLLERVIVPDEI